MDLFRNILYYTFVAPVRLVASVFTVWIPKPSQLQIAANERTEDNESCDIETPRKKKPNEDPPINSPYKVSSPFKTVQDLALQLITKEVSQYTTSSSSFSQRNDNNKPRCTPRQDSSRTRNLYIEAPRSDIGVHNIATPIVTGDENLIQCNHLYFATSVQRGAGAFAVLPISDCRKYDINEPIIDGHTAPVSDFAFNPFNHSLIASASEDCTVKLWNIPTEGLKSNMTTATMTLNGHYRKVTSIKFHPTVSTLLASVSIDGSSKLWDIEYGKTIHSIEKAYDASYHDMVWNNMGSSYIISSKDQRIHYADARQGIISHTIINAHDGSKCIKLISLDDDADRILSVGNTKGSMRQVKIWDPRNISTEVMKLDIDNSAGTLMPFYDSYSNLLYLAGKGDGNVRMCDVNQYGITQLSEFKSNIATKGMAILPKRVCDVMKCEIGRLLKLTANSSVQPLSVYVPRQSTTFQQDLYPDIYGDIAPHTKDVWLNSDSNIMPVKVSLKPSSSIPVLPLSCMMSQTSSVANTPRYNDNTGGFDDHDDGMITIQTPRMMSASLIEFLKRPSHTVVTTKNKTTVKKLRHHPNTNITTSIASAADCANNSNTGTSNNNKENNHHNEKEIENENEESDDDDDDEAKEILRRQLSSDLRKAKLMVFELENKCRRAGISLQ